MNEPVPWYDSWRLTLIVRAMQYIADLRLASGGAI